MLRPGAPVLVLLLAVFAAGAGIYFLLLTPGAGEDPALDLLPADPREAPVAPAPREETPRTLGGRPPGSPPAPVRRGPEWPVLPTDAIPRGTLEVLPLMPDGKPWPTADVRLRLDREGAAFWSTPLGSPDPETGVWTFRDLPIGRLRVTVVGAQVVETTKPAEVRTGVTDRVEVFADRGASVLYAATLYSGERPASFRLEVLAAERRTPVRAWFEGRGPDHYTTAQPSTGGSVRAVGRVFGLAPGRYVLRATSLEGEIDEVEVTLAAGESREVEIQLRK